MQNLLTPQNILPHDHSQAVLIGRIWIDGLGPTLVRVCQEHIYDISGVAPTCTQLLELDDPAAAVRTSGAPRFADTAEVLANSVLEQRTAGKPWFLAPCDLQAIKAAGNYGELYDEFFGPKALDLARGQNKLWNAGGLQYSLPFR